MGHTPIGVGPPGAHPRLLGGGQRADRPERYNRAKLEAYECGIEPTPQPVGGGRFPVKYYMTAMLFIVFDIEIVFLFPWAVRFDDIKVFALVEMVIFVAHRVRRLRLRVAPRRPGMGLSHTWVSKRRSRAASC